MADTGENSTRVCFLYVWYEELVNGRLFCIWQKSGLNSCLRTYL